MLRALGGTVWRARPRGAALVMAVFFMTLLFGIGLAFIRLIPGEYYAAQRLQSDTAGYYVADAGVSVALAWLEAIGPAGVATNDSGADWANFNNNYPPLPTSNPNPSLGGVKNLSSGGTWSIPTGASPSAAAPMNVTNKFLPGWEFNAQIQRWHFCDAASNKNTYFVIISEAKRLSNQHAGYDTFRRVRCWARPASFADDAYAVDRLPSAIWLNLNTFKLNGPYRTNDEVMLYTRNSGGSGGFWPSASPRPPAINGTISFWKGDPNPIPANYPSPLVMPSPQENRHAIDGSFFNGSNTVQDGVLYSRHDSQDYLPYQVGTGAVMEDRYKEITANGRSGITMTNTRQDMPENTENLANIALGAAAPSPGASLAKTNVATSVFNSTSTINLHATTTGTGMKTLASGFYVEGSVDNITLSTPVATLDGNGNSSDGNYNSAIRIKQGSSSANIITVYETLTLPIGAIVNGGAPLTAINTLSAGTNGAGYTVVQDVSNPLLFKVFEGTGNGAYFVNGDINAFSGKNRGRKTFATQTDNGNSTTYDKSITINGNVTRADTTVGTNVTGVRDQLGFLSYKVKIADNAKLQKDDGTAATRSSTTDSNPLYLYGAFVLGRRDDPLSTDQINGGGMGSVNYNDSSQGIGAFKLFGSLTEGVRQVKGVIGSSGMNYQYYYDSNMTQVPPPFFPQKSRFRIDAWNEEAVFNY